LDRDAIRRGHSVGAVVNCCMTVTSCRRADPTVLACCHEGRLPLLLVLNRIRLSRFSSPQVMIPEFVPCVRAAIYGANARRPYGVAGVRGRAFSTVRKPISARRFLSSAAEGCAAIWGAQFRVHRTARRRPVRRTALHGPRSRLRNTPLLQCSGHARAASLIA
jgi:hypothetical protein